jgi:hypothetical protein
LVVFLYARTFTSSTKPIPKARRIRVLQIMTWLTLLKRKRIGDSSKPWKMQVCGEKASVL